MSVKPGETVVRDLLEWMAAHLREDPWYATHGVTILVENQLDILYQIKLAVSSKTGIALVLKASRVENMRPKLSVTLEGLAIENPTLNRNRANAATALDVASHLAIALDGPCAMMKFLEHSEDPPLFKSRVVFDTLIDR